MRKILHADQRLKQNHQEDNLRALHQEQFLLGRELGLMLNKGNISFSDYEVSKKLMYLLRHSQQVYREEDGAVQFWRIKENLQKHFPHSPHWSDSKWKKSMAGRRKQEKISSGSFRTQDSPHCRSSTKSKSS